VNFQVPVAVTVLRVSADYHLQSFALLDAPQFRPAEITRKFWYGCSLYPQSRIVTFNGRSFDLPLMELAAYRFGYSMGDYMQSSRNRFTGTLDLHDWLTNFGAAKIAGGLDLLAKLLGKPGRFETVPTDQLHREGRIAEINSYCLCDTLDTYFVFLRTRVMTGELTREAEIAITNDAREYLESKSKDYPILATYLASWK
jgi:predicted PolB exonuclease-like 3'-5' exonuclease